MRTANDNLSPLVDRLAALMAEVCDAVLLTVREPGSPHDISLTVGSFRPDLGERMAVLLEEAGR